MKAAERITNLPKENKKRGRVYITRSARVNRDILRTRRGSGRERKDDDCEPSSLRSLIRQLFSQPTSQIHQPESPNSPPPPSPSTSLSSIPKSHSPPPPSPFNNDPTVFVGCENMPLEGVIQFDKPDSSARIRKWGKVALLAGGDVLALLTFAAIGRFSHGFPVFDFETLRTADPFIAGWFLSAYFLGGLGENGRGINGFSKAVTASAKSWALGIPLGIGIRASTAGHIPSIGFMLVSMGSTAVLLLGWRTLLYKFLPGNKRKKSDVYRRGSLFELPV